MTSEPHFRPHNGLKIERAENGDLSVTLTSTLQMTAPAENIGTFGAEAVSGVLADRICAEYLHDRDEMARVIREGIEQPAQASPYDAG